MGEAGLVVEVVEEVGKPEVVASRSATPGLAGQCMAAATR